jgi:hypothetical protein
MDWEAEGGFSTLSFLVLELGGDCVTEMITKTSTVL